MLRAKQWACLFGGIILFIDAYVKYIIWRDFPLMDSVYPLYPYGGIGVFQNLWGIEFSICHTTNTGAAWGMFGDHQWPLLVLRIGLITGLLYYYFKKIDVKAYILPLAMIIAGAVGNVLDTFLYGHVIDMFHFRFWGYQYPLFNIADSAICVGVLTLAFFTLFPGKAQAQS